MRIDDDKKFMARALELAANGMGHTRLWWARYL